MRRNYEEKFNEKKILNLIIKIKWKNINVYENIDINEKNNGNRNNFEKEIKDIFDEIKKVKKSMIK